MSTRLTRGVVICSTVCSAVSLFAVLSVGGADTPTRKPGGKSAPVYDTFAPANEFSRTTPPPAGPFDPAPSEPGVPKAPKSNRIMFESTWKNVHVGSKAVYFRQGDRPFVWTVKNTGDNPVGIGDDYGFSIAPGEEEFIVDQRLILFVADDKMTTVEVKASRVMAQGELAGEPTPTPADAPSANVPRGVKKAEDHFKSL